MEFHVPSLHLADLGKCAPESLVILPARLQAP